MRVGRVAQLIASGCAAVCLLLYLMGAFTRAHYVWKDLLFQLAPSTVKAGDPRLIMLAIDDEAGKKYGFPLPRTFYVRALDKLKTLGVRTAVFDVLFFEPRAGDADLAAATRRFGRVVHLYSLRVQDTGGGSSVKTDLPVAPLREAGRRFGYPDIGHLLDNDAHLRVFQLSRPGVGDPLRSGRDAASVAAVALAADRDEPVEDVISRCGSQEKSLNFRRPRLWLMHERRDAQARARGVKNLEEIESPYRRVPLIDLLEGRLSQAQTAALKGSLLIIGSTTLGYYDHYPTPFLDSVPGAEYHLNVIDNLMHGDALADAPGWQAALGVLAACALSYGLLAVSPAVSTGLAAAVLAAWFFAALALFRRGLIVEFVPPAFALIASYLALTVRRALTEGAEKKMIKGLFGQFVAPEVVEQLAQDPSKVKLGGEKRDMTVFFLDIAHFTNISEKMDPEALIQFLNKYLSALSQVILERRGTIDKYIGDCIMAFWNAPIANPEHRVDAVLAALECQKTIQELNKTLDPGLPEAPAVRIGINAGVATVGLTGSQKKLQYTVIGDEVNLASRLEGANKFFGSKIIISESAYEGAKARVAVRTLGRVRVVGKETPIKIYEPIAEAGQLDEAWRKALPIYERGVAAFDARRYDEALAEFQSFAEILPEDGPGQLYLGRCQEYAVIPPDAAWEGVFNLTAK